MNKIEQKKRMLKRISDARKLVMDGTVDAILIIPIKANIGHYVSFSGDPGTAMQVTFVLAQILAGFAHDNYVQTLPDYMPTTETGDTIQ